MLRQDPPNVRSGGLNIQRELDRLEEMVLDSPRFPLSKRTLVDEEQLLEQLDQIRLNLPSAFEEAEEVLNQKDEIIGQANRYAQEVIEAAKQQASQLVEESGLLRQVEVEANQIRRRLQQEIEEARSAAMAEIAQMRRQAQSEWEAEYQRAVAERDQIQRGADEYADQTLSGLEQQLNDLMRIVRNGRQQLRS
ncbi:hypothetical protein [Leptolyngbya sp. FACHB-261]|uniref:hypothetical protein n=1 Tax=Leptolyngbya sp. FACHB-261 TaxID=2692806 RepID=UPI001686ED14|nr:hypothetical protein [Leptolyngbya sp. FACHB-261]MBD2101341.1 hypothetical protein [Leptolyngbya sp. FACHB-261]